MLGADYPRKGGQHATTTQSTSTSRGTLPAMDLIFEEPSQAALLRQRPGKYVEFAIALRDHQDRWALLPDDGAERGEKAAQSLAQNIRRGVTSGFAKGEYDCVADGGKVYVKFTGAKKDQPQNPGEGESTPPSDKEGERGRHRAWLIRQWARDNGYTVPDKGRLSDEVTSAYDAAIAAQEDEPASA